MPTHPDRDETLKVPGLSLSIPLLSQELQEMAFKEIESFSREPFEEYWSESNESGKDLKFNMFQPYFKYLVSFAQDPKNKRLVSDEEFKRLVSRLFKLEFLKPGYASLNSEIKKGLKELLTEVIRAKFDGADDIIDQAQFMRGRLSSRQELDGEDDNKPDMDEVDMILEQVNLISKDAEFTWDVIHKKLDFLKSFKQDKFLRDLFFLFPFDIQGQGKQGTVNVLLRLLNLLNVNVGPFSGLKNTILDESGIYSKLEIKLDYTTVPHRIVPMYYNAFNSLLKRLKAVGGWQKILIKGEESLIKENARIFNGQDSLRNLILLESFERSHKRSHKLPSGKGELAGLVVNRAIAEIEAQENILINAMIPHILIGRDSDTIGGGDAPAAEALLQRIDDVNNEFKKMFPDF